VRDRIRDLSVKALRDRSLSRRDVSKLVHDAFGGAMEGVDQSIPRAGGNVLREVFEGLREGVNAVASAGSGAVRGAKARGTAVAKKDAPAAAKRIRAANEEFLGAVGMWLFFSSLLAALIGSSMESASQSALVRGEKLLKLRDELRGKVQLSKGSVRLLELVDHLFAAPMITVPEAEESHRAAGYRSAATLPGCAYAFGSGGPSAARSSR
jgi:hypothetical protein